MTKTIGQQAMDIICKHAVPASCNVEGALLDATTALQSAGLLVTERDALCRKLADGYLLMRAAKLGSDDKWSAIRAVDRDYEALAAYDREHAPKPRWKVTSLGVAGDSTLGMTHVVVDTHNEGCTRFMGTEAECKAIAETLNKLAEAK